MARQSKSDNTKLVKVNNRVVIRKMIEMEASVIHITGDGSAYAPKYFFFECVPSETIDKLDEKEKLLIEEAEYSEIDKLVSVSKKNGDIEKEQFAAQKKKPGAEPVASQHYQ